jgi:co-chaperonin GroES (HSP10)
VKPKDLEERNTVLLGDMKLYLASEYRQDLRERNPGTAIITILDKENKLNLKVGDEVIVHYLTFYDHSYNLKSGVKIEGEQMWPITFDDVFAVIRDGELCPVGEFVFGDVVKKKTLQSSFLIIPDGVGEEIVENKAIVTKTSSINKLGLNVGDEVILVKYANYELKHEGQSCLRFRESEIIALCK